MKALKGFIAAGVLAAASAQASNFSYTYVEGGLGMMWLDEDIVFEDDFQTYRYEDFALATFSGGYQFSDYFALRMTGSGIAAEEGPTEISQSQASISASFPVAVAPGLDVVPVVGFMNVDAEFCDESWNNYRSCYTEDDSGILYGVLSRYWAVRDELEINAGLTDSSIDGTEPAFSLGGAYWFKKSHSVRVNFTGNSDSSSLTFGYAFTWR